MTDFVKTGITPDRQRQIRTRVKRNKRPLLIWIILLILLNIGLIYFAYGYKNILVRDYMAWVTGPVAEGNGFFIDYQARNIVVTSMDAIGEVQPGVTVTVNYIDAGKLKAFPNATVLNTDTTKRIAVIELGGDQLKRKYPVDYGSESEIPRNTGEGQLYQKFVSAGKFVTDFLVTVASTSGESGFEVRPSLDKDAILGAPVLIPNSDKIVGMVCSVSGSSAGDSMVVEIASMDDILMLIH